MLIVRSIKVLKRNKDNILFNNINLILSSIIVKSFK